MFDTRRRHERARLRTPFEILRTSVDSSPELKLWRAVIIQAFNDATSKAKDDEAVNHAMVAKKWLRYLGDDFRSVCAFADVEHVHIFRQAKKLLKIHEQKAARRASSRIKPREKVRKLPNIVRSMM